MKRQDRVLYNKLNKTKSILDRLYDDLASIYDTAFDRFRFDVDPKLTKCLTDLDIGYESMLKNIEKAKKIIENRN